MSAEDNELSNKYQQKTDKEHILSNPETYIGSPEKMPSEEWILNGDKICKKMVDYIPGLYKLVDEAIVNCRDHVIRMQQAVTNNKADSLPVSYIDISIDDEGVITMINDGNGIDVAEHPEHKMWIPEMIFGHLRTSTNYDKTEKKIVGGKNGFGVKLIFIWSTYGLIETVDHTRGLKYKQEFKNNLNEICKPSITKCKTKPYTKIVFKPDYARFGLDKLSDDFISLIKKRVYDITAITSKNLKVKYNSSLVPIKSFQQYVDLYIGNKTDCPRIYEECNDRWEYAVALTPVNEFVQISFVNGIHTSKGGKHVEYVLNQITRKLMEYIEKKKKTKVNANSIKEQLMLFLRCDLENPSFDSQTKDYVNTPYTKFGSKCEVSDKFIDKLAKMGVMDTACALTDVKECKASKKTDGTKSKNIRGIPKLTDANWAGTDKSSECMIIFCEGDSAKAGILSGLSSEDRNTFGVYPMKGKMLNVRGENVKKINDNKEIAEIKKILGLETGKVYKTIEDVNKNLRYGKILFMTDQDLDGSHIKGLGINLFHSEWASLIEIPGVLGFMNTPILKAKKGDNELQFYNDGEYELWKEENDPKGWKIKYFKGLGTSTGKEFKEYFRQKKIVGFKYEGESSVDSIDMVFNKKRADDRKVWLSSYDRKSYLDTGKDMVSYEEFINRELIHFSKYDCDRSIPNLMDGLKISLRKILYATFKKNLINEIKVAQFSGYVSEHSGYHHGEASLNGAIVGMAQNFVGSNNINLLVPNGQFGTRLQGGKDSASERYIFTLLNKITRSIFPAADDNILTYLDDDGQIVEPLFYCPIIPMILINGSKGIGTGFSTDIPPYNPREIINYLKNKLQHKETSVDFIPYYEGFQGTIEKVLDNKFLIKGTYIKLDNDKIRVTELPVGLWTDDFKELLEKLAEPEITKDGKKKPAVIKDYDDMSKDTNVNFDIVFAKGKLAELESITHDYACNGVYKLLKLYTTVTTTNMHLFNAHEKLHKYESITEIIDDYFETRIIMYEKRKNYMIDLLTHELEILQNKVRYITEMLNDTIDLRKKTKDQVINMLKEKGYSPLKEDYDFKYLTKMTMDSVTNENIDKLTKDFLEKEKELNDIKNKTINNMWLEELDKVSQEYDFYKEQRERLSTDVVVKKKKVIKKTKSLTIED
jgi:DNA topoisomerase-2